MGANACTRQVTKQSAELLFNAYNSQVENFLANEVQSITVAGTSGDAPTVVTGLNAINVAEVPLVEEPITTAVVVNPGYASSVMVDYNLRYSTVNAFTPNTDILPGPWEASPFMLEIVDHIVDTTVVPQTTPPTRIPRPATATAPNPVYYLLPRTSMTVRPTAADFVASGRLQLPSGLFTSPLTDSYPLKKTISLVWVYNTGDWNQGNTTDLGGYTIPAVVNPFPSTLPPVGQLAPTDSRISFEIRQG